MSTTEHGPPAQRWTSQLLHGSFRDHFWAKTILLRGQTTEFHKAESTLPAHCAVQDWLRLPNHLSISQATPSVDEVCKTDYRIVGNFCEGFIFAFFASQEPFAKIKTLKFLLDTCKAIENYLPCLRKNERSWSAGSH